MLIKGNRYKLLQNLLNVFGVYDILNSSGAQTGIISDLYII
jgi:hypothetical protein